MPILWTRSRCCAMSNWSAPDGIVTYIEAAIPIVASVQSAAGDSLMMTPDLARSGSTYDIITTFPLATATDANKADTVIWRGIEFRGNGRRPVRQFRQQRRAL